MTRAHRPLPDGLFDNRRTRTASAATVAPPEESALPDELVIPEDLATLETEDLQGLHDQAVEIFNAIYGDGEAELTDAEFATLSAVTEQVERLRSEIDTRETAAAERREGMRELAGRVNPADSGDEADPEGDPEGGEDTDPAEGSEGGEGTQEGDQFAGRAHRVPLSSLRRRTQRPAARPSGQATTMRELVTAAADLPGYSNGQGMDWADIGRAVDRRLAGFNKAQYQAANRAGRAMRQQFGVAAIRRPIPADLMINGNDPAHVDDVIRRAVDQSRLPGGSLVAAGGWCAPSTILYDLLELETGDGIVSVPEIGISRGGIQFTTGPDFAEIYANTGWSYSEGQDIAGSYSGGTNEVQTITITGAPTGGSFTLTFETLVSDPIPWNATAAQVAAAVTEIVDAHYPGGIVTGAGANLPAGSVALTFGGTLADTNVAAMTQTSSLTGGTTPTAVVTQTTAGVIGTGGKPCYSVTCPDFTEERLDLMGLCISSGLLQQRGYPEVLARTTRGALIAHEHRMAAEVIRRIAVGSTQVVMPTSETGTLTPLLSAIELQVEHYRYVHRMSRTQALEAIFPHWVFGAVRRDLSHRLAVDYLAVTDAQITAWFSQRGIAAQFVYNYQDMSGSASSSSATAYPTTVQFLLYSAGTWVKGTSDIITLDTIYDSVNLAQNDFTALFTEEGFLVAKRGFDSRAVTVTFNGTLGQ